MTLAALAAAMIAAADAPTGAASTPAVPFCELLARPEQFVGKTAEVEAIETATLDERAHILIGPTCKGRDGIVFDAASPSVLAPLYAYRVPDAVQQGGAFWFWVTVKGQVVRVPAVEAYGISDDGLHFRVESVVKVEARHAD